MDEEADDLLRPVDHVLLAYYNGDLTTAQAANEMLLLTEGHSSFSFNAEIGPALRRLFAELHRFAPDRFALLPGPDPSRHANDGRRMLDGAAVRYWMYIQRDGLHDAAFSVSYCFATAESDSAEGLQTYLGGRPDQRVTLRSPDEADADDWQVSGITPAQPWTLADLKDLFQWLANAPIPPGRARFTGHSLRHAGPDADDAA